MSSPAVSAYLVAALGGNTSRDEFLGMSDLDAAIAELLDGRTPEEALHAIAQALPAVMGMTAAVATGGDHTSHTQIVAAVMRKGLQRGGRR